MAGITVGLTVSLMGLVIGRLVGFIWMKITCRSSRGYTAAVQDEDDDVPPKTSWEEKDSRRLDPLPAYEPAPPYMDAELE
jgi:hypothetical protein